MDRAKLEEIRAEVSACWHDEGIKINFREFVLGTIVEILDVLLEDPKPVAIETGMDTRTRMKKLILEMLEIV